MHCTVVGAQQWDDGNGWVGPGRPDIFISASTEKCNTWENSKAWCTQVEGRHGDKIDTGQKYATMQITAQPQCNGRENLWKGWKFRQCSLYGEPLIWWPVSSPIPAIFANKMRALTTKSNHSYWPSVFVQGNELILIEREEVRWHGWPRSVGDIKQQRYNLPGQHHALMSLCLLFYWICNRNRDGWHFIYSDATPTLSPRFMVITLTWAYSACRKIFEILVPLDARKSCFQQRKLTKIRFLDYEIPMKFFEQPNEEKYRKNIGFIGN